MGSITSDEAVVLRLKLDSFNQSEDGVDEIILSRFNNTINELRNGKITTSFQLPQRITVVQQLRVFYSYKPKLKHYLFMNGSDLIILRKVEDVIEIVHIYKSVTNFDIADDCNSGKPHLFIYTTTGQEGPIVTDCVRENRLSLGPHEDVQTFAPYIHKSMLRIKNAENVLREKTKVFSKLSRVLAFNCDDDQILSITDQVVFLREGLSSTFTGLPTKGSALSVGEPWLKTHLNCWIIGFPIINTSNQDMCRFEMFITHEFITAKKTLLFTLVQKAEQIDIYSQSIKFPIGHFGILVAVTQQPYLIHETFTVKCACRFEVSSSDEMEQCFLGFLEITTSDLGETNNNTQLFSPNLSVNDLISIQAASKCYELTLSTSKLITEFLESLVEVQKFNRLSNTVFLNCRASGIYSSLLLIVDPISKKIRTFVSSENDCLLLTHKLRDNLSLDHPKGDPIHTVQNTSKEIKYIKGIVIHELIGTESNSSPPPAIDLEEGFHDMMVLEIESAAAMNSLKMRTLHINSANKRDVKWNKC